MSDEGVKAAEQEVDRTRARLTASLQELSRQFAPHRLMEEVWEKAKDKGADIAEDAVDAVRSRPYAATGVVAAIAMFMKNSVNVRPASGPSSRSSPSWTTP